MDLKNLNLEQDSNIVEIEKHDNHDDVHKNCKTKCEIAIENNKKVIVDLTELNDMINEHPKLINYVKTKMNGDFKEFDIYYDLFKKNI